MDYLIELSQFLEKLSFAKIGALFITIAILAPIWLLAIVLIRKVNRVQVMKVGNLELTEADVQEELIKREELKMAVLIALSDGNVEPQEEILLNRLALKKGRDISKLTMDQRLAIIEEGAWMAAADKIFQEEEYVALKKRASQFKIDVEQLDQIIIDTCINEDAQPPLPLKDRFELERKERGLSVNSLSSGKA